MNKQKFIEFLRRPTYLNEKNIGYLEKLTQEYPYFQSARTLLAKISKINKSKMAKKHINSAAIYATDRLLLKRYLSDELIFLSPMNVHESHEADYDRDIKEKLKTVKSTSIRSKIKNNPQVWLKSKSVAPPPLKPATDVSEKAKSALEKRQPAPVPRPIPKKSERVTENELSKLTASSSSKLDQLIQDLYLDMKELKVNREKFMERERSLEEEEAVDKALKKATTKSKAAEDSSKSDKKKAEEREKDEPSNKEETTGNAEAPDIKEAPEKKENNEALKKASGSRSARGNHTSEKSPPAVRKGTTEIKKKTSEKKVATAKKTTKSTDSKTIIKKTDSSGISKTKKTENTKDESRKSEQNNIISNFIKKNPSISQVDSKQKNDIDLSNESTAFHPEFASEYLAEIYLNQGKKDRAIQIYEALVVRFPEKSVYFADIINKLKE